MFQRERETLTQIYEQMVKFMFDNYYGNVNQDIYGLNFYLDCGYWTPCLLFMMLYLWGADIVGTVVCCFWFPFDYSILEYMSFIKQ